MAAPMSDQARAAALLEMVMEIARHGVDCRCYQHEHGYYVVRQPGRPDSETFEPELYLQSLLDEVTKCDD